GLFLHSEDLNSGEREYLRQRGAYGQPAPSGAPASPPVPAGQPAAANAPAGGTLAERLANSALGRLIARGEGGYSSVNRGERGGYAAGTEDLANMTLAEVMAAQRSGKFNAAGRYQIVRDTLAEAARALNLKGDEKFDQKLQDRIFGDYLLTRKRRAIGDFLSGKSSDLHAALLATSREWASVANPDTGRSYYDGVGKNHASITAKELENALRNSQSLFGPAGAIAVAQRGAPHIEVHQDVRIEVSGASDPAATARAVANEQHAVTDKAFRYGGQLTYAFSE
ncbi:glucosaminidase, partial [Burkholderia gladioli]